MEESTPPTKKKIRLTRSEAYAMRISSPRKKKVTFGLIGLLIAAILGVVLWHFQDGWLSYWIPEQEPVAPVVVQPLTPEPIAPPVAEKPAAPHPGDLDVKLDFLSAAVWDNPQFLQGIRLFNQALDRQRQFLRDRSQPVLLVQAEEGALQAAQTFEDLRAAAPPAVPLADYAARCRKLVDEIRLIRKPAPPPPAAPAQVRTPVPAHTPGQPWQHPDYLQGAKLFNQALAQYKLFLSNKTRTELLKPIEEDAFAAAKKFESLKGQAPNDVPLGDHISQCYKLISDCRRQHLEGPSASPEPENTFDRGTAGPNRRPALPAYQPPQ